MNEKEEKILMEINDYYFKNRMMPTRRYLQKKFNFKSVNSITEYIKSLEKQNYLIRNSDNKIILNKFSEHYNANLKTIRIINSNNQYAQIILDKRKKYLGYKIKNNFFTDIGIMKNDIMIVEMNKKLKDNDLGLFIIDKKYRIMKYRYKDGFYILTDDEELLLNKVKIIGKVILIERKSI